MARASPGAEAQHALAPRRLPRGALDMGQACRARHSSATEDCALHVCAYLGMCMRTYVRTCTLPHPRSGPLPMHLMNEPRIVTGAGWNREGPGASQSMAGEGCSLGLAPRPMQSAAGSAASPCWQAPQWAVQPQRGAELLARSRACGRFPLSRKPGRSPGPPGAPLARSAPAPLPAERLAAGECAPCLGPGR